MFGRVLAVDIAGTGSTGLRFSKSDIEFDVSYGSSGEPATADLTLYGVSKSHLNDYLSLAYLKAKITAGYRGPGYGQIFSGTSEAGSISHTRTGGTYVLKVGLKAGGVITTSAVQISESGGTLVFDIATRIAQQLGTTLLEYSADKGATLPSGYSSNLNGYDALRKLAAYLGCGVSFEDDGIRFYDFAGSTLQKGNAVLLSSASKSLLEFSVGADSEHRIRYNITCILRHELRPGSYIVVNRFNKLLDKNEVYNIVAEDVKHSGSYRGGIMRTTVTGRMV